MKKICFLWYIYLERRFYLCLDFLHSLCKKGNLGVGKLVSIMEKEIVKYSGEIYNPIAAIAANKASTKYYVDRWGTVSRKNPNLPEEAPKREHSSGWEGDSRR